MRLGLVAACLAAAACSSLAENSDGVAAIEFQLPTNLYLEHQVPLVLRAVALDAHGATVDAPIVWRTPTADTVATLDSLTGELVGLRFPDSVRVQVALQDQDDLTSSFAKLVFKITDRADTLALLSADSVEVVADTDTSAAIQVQLSRFSGAAVAGRPVAFRIVEPVQTTDSTISFVNGRLVDSLLTPATGQLSTIRLRSVRGRVPPDRAVVEVTAYRASGDPIAGSPRRVVVRFLHQ